MSNFDLPHGPLYDPKSRVMNFKFAEDFGNICLNLLGTGGLFEDPDFHYYWQDIEWRRPTEICRRPMFINGRPSRFDALQGDLNNCWLLSAFGAITLNDKLIAHVVPPDQSFEHDYIGAFHFRIWQFGTWYDVVVDDRLPFNTKKNKLVSAFSLRGDVFWATLLEKAYAKFHKTDYQGLHIGKKMNSLQDLSGGIVERMFLRKNSVPEVNWMINEVFSKDALMYCECKKTDKNLVKNHTYTVTNVFKCSDNDPVYPGFFLVRLMNPWGYKEWKGDWRDDDDKWKTIDRVTYELLNVVPREDGEFWMNENDLINYMYNVHICHLGPGQFLSSRQKEMKTWRNTSFFGSWVKKFSAGGADLPTRHLNPQYRILLDGSENDVNKDGMFTVVIQLIQRSNYEDRPNIGFFIYSLTKLKVDKPLNKQFFMRNKPIFSPNFQITLGSDFTVAINLKPGKYCIVPCTELKGEVSRFLLRIFSESQVDLWEYDTKISKSLAMEEQIVNEFNETLQSLFNDIARDQGEIDWIRLKEILEKAMNPKKSFFMMFSSLFKYIKDVIELYFSLGSSEDYETGDIVFTKDECRSMIAMLDDDHSGKLSFSEFSNLWNKICFWTKVYEQHRDETEGFVTVSQLRDALSSIGYNVNKETVHNLSYVYANEQGIIRLTDFILCGVTLETVLTRHQKNDVEGGNNKITFTLEEWVKNTLIL